MKILIDGDACPVKNEIYELAEKYELKVMLVTSVSHYSVTALPEFVSTVYVDEGADSADYRIVKLTEAGDIVVTQDYGLASLVLGKRAVVLHHLGKEYTTVTIDLMLESRHHNAKVRKSGGRTKGPKKLTADDRQHFSEKLEDIIKRQL
ncbi:YaiI/YqxD family protein [Vagococcus coleopterorum]|uniref:UPF0178 protein G7081_03100 n=1 Tax=Vagococcus coleopterorum TaxID=2714946 RepID=A0A6G8AMA2_9ENTE|nr:YaiI/YqxD family protein [Vagococcus coleopterorum]QIL46127.1 YaiI/YqxD family protein [Vagococcus coleopterorum]